MQFQEAAHTGADEGAGWLVVETAERPERRRIAEALLTVQADGVATRGAVEEDGPGTLPAVYVNEVFTASGPDEHLLSTPSWTQVTELEPIPPSDDRRVLDLRTGVLERTRTAKVFR